MDSASTNVMVIDIAVSNKLQNIIPLGHARQHIWQYATFHLPKSSNKSHSKPSIHESRQHLMYVYSLMPKGGEKKKLRTNHTGTQEKEKKKKKD